RAAPVSFHFCSVAWREDPPGSADLQVKLFRFPLPQQQPKRGVTQGAGLDNASPAPMESASYR
ncbi:MAG: hypothetical protein LJE70_03670, partial [Chromatiaceae bacterium]|nr:hypothetical protein [Chromatiaceae bacterium]